MKYILLLILTIAISSCLDGELYGYQTDVKKIDSVVYIPFEPSDSTEIAKDSVDDLSKPVVYNFKNINPHQH